MSKSKFDWALVFLKYSELFGKKRRLSRIKKDLRPFKLSSVLATLAQINIPLSFMTLAKDDPSLQGLQEGLSSRFLDAKVRENPKFIQARTDEKLVFTRQQM